MSLTALATPPVPISDPSTPRRARRLGWRVDDPNGPWLVAVAGLHGNETAGIAALERVFATLEASSERLHGALVAFAGNLAALEAGQRYLDRDLNRIWSRAALARARSGGVPATSEERELVALADDLDDALAEAKGRVHLLDLHTTSGAGPAFVVLDDALPNRRFALDFQAPLVLGLEEELAGTMVFHWTAQGVLCVAFEGGQHADPGSIDRSEAAVWIALDSAGILPTALEELAEAGRRLLRANRGSAPRLVEVIRRHRIEPEDGFRMHAGFANFAVVEKNQPLASDVRGTVGAPAKGRLLMPLYQSQGDDGYFLAVPVNRFWFELSALLRRGRVDRILPWLPGIRPHPTIAGAFVVNRLVARWAVRKIFHLLGYRRLEKRRWRVVYGKRAGER